MDDILRSYGLKKLKEEMFRLNDREIHLFTDTENKEFDKRADEIERTIRMLESNVK